MRPRDRHDEGRGQPLSGERPRAEVLSSPWALRVAAALGALPLALSRHLPFCDLPEHVAVIATLRHWWDPAWRSQEYFFVAGATKTQYLLYYFVGAALAVPFGSAERANLFLLVLVALGFPYGLRALLRALRGDERLAILGAPFFWNRVLAEGLVTYVAAIPPTLFALALAAEQVRAPTRRRAFALVGLSLAIFYLHVSALVVLVGGSVLLAWLLPERDAKRARPELAAILSAPRRLAWLVPLLAIALAFAATGSLTHPDPSQGAHAGRVRFTPRAMLVGELWGWMHDVWRSPIDDWAAAAMWIALVLLAIWPDREPYRPWSREAVAARALALMALALYFFLPAQVSFAFLLDVRMAPFVALFAVLLVRRRDDRAGAALRATLAGASLVFLAHGAWQMRAWETEEAAHFDEVLRGLPRGKRLLTLVFHKDSPRLWVTPFVHFGAYYRARYGGIASFSFSELPHWPVQYRPEIAPPKKAIVFWDWNPCLFRNAHDGPYYDYVLVRGEVDPFAEGPPGPRWKIVGAARDWRLWQRVEGSWVDAGDAPDAGPCPVQE